MRLEAGKDKAIYLILLDLEIEGAVACSAESVSK